MEHFTSSSSASGGVICSIWLSFFKVLLQVFFVPAEVFGFGIFLDLHLFSAAAIGRVGLKRFFDRRRTAGDGGAIVDEALAAVSLKLYALFVRYEVLLVSIFSRCCAEKIN